MLEVDSIKISVVIPICNVELYIERCVRSLMEQTLENIEFIFVNDCTLDKSMDILQHVLEEYPARKKSVKIIEHKENRGLAAARNTGLNNVTGEYIIHCDSDDWIEKDMYEKLLRKALKTCADIVVCDFYDDYIGYSVVRKQPFPQESQECIKRMMNGELQCNTWNKLIARKLYERTKIYFPEGVNMWEDVSTIIPLCFHANIVAYVSEPLYHYIHYNTGSYLTRMNQSSLYNLIEALELIEVFLKEQEVYQQYAGNLCFMKLTVKLNLLLGSKGEQQKKWNNLYSEANIYIWQSTYISIYWKLALQFAALNMLFLFNIMAQLGKVLRSIKSR